MLRRTGYPFFQLDEEPYGRKKILIGPTVIRPFFFLLVAYLAARDNPLAALRPGFDCLYVMARKFKTRTGQ